MTRLKLNLQLFAGEKTEKATPKKREDERKKGKVVKSQDMTTAFSLLILFMSLFIIGSFSGKHLLYVMKHALQSYVLEDVTEQNIQLIVLDMLKEMAYIVGPILAVAFVAGFIANVAQIGVRFNFSSIQPKFEKINPLSGMKRIFAIRSLVELVKSLLKIAFIGTATFAVLWLHRDEVLNLSLKSVQDDIHIIGSLTIQMGLVASLSLLFIGVFDYIYQKLDFEKNIRMSKQDIKDEYKNSEGDPHIKSRIKQRQREMATRRMMQEVPHADVIITNPTHYAIALKYDELERDAPYVVAKGVDFLAEKIKSVAAEENITMIENRPLARALYAQTDLGDSIPEEFFKAVAEVLAYVYRLRNK